MGSGTHVLGYPDEADEVRVKGIKAHPPNPHLNLEI